MEQIYAASREALEWLRRFSASPEASQCLIVGGSLLYRQEAGGPLYNASPVLFRGDTLGFYYKRILYKAETEKLQPGAAPLLFEHPLTKETWGVMICADVTQGENFEAYREAAHIAIPTASPYRPGDTPEEQARRDKEIYLEGAKRAGAAIYKCCSVGQNATTGGGLAAVQGRSLVCTPRQLCGGAPHIDWSGAMGVVFNGKGNGKGDAKGDLDVEFHTFLPETGVRRPKNAENRDRTQP